MPRTYPAQLATLGDGALAELVDLAIQQMTADTLDPNKSATAKRSTTITLDLLPGKGRTAGVFKVKVQTKLAAPEPLELTVFMGRENGHPVMMEHNPDQMPLPLAPVSIDRTANE